MKRTKSPNNQKKVKRSLKPKRGPKSKCTQKVIQEAYKLALLNLTISQMAGIFNVHEDTVKYWYREKDHFRQAVDKGRDLADGNVAEALYETAIGYEHPSFKFYKIPVTEKEYDKEGNVIKERSYSKIKKVPFTKKYKPDTKAALKFLGVRHRKDWGESYKVEHKHAHMHVGEAHIHTILDQLSDTDQFTTNELKTIAKLGLTQQANQLSADNEIHVDQ